MKSNYIGQDTLRRGMEQSVFKPVIPAGTELASMSIVVAPQERNVPLKVGNGTRTMLPVRNFSTRMTETKENVTQITPLVCQYVLVKGTISISIIYVMYMTWNHVCMSFYIFVHVNH